MAVGGKGI